MTSASEPGERLAALSDECVRLSADLTALRERHAAALEENVKLKRQAADAYDYLEHEFDTVDGEDGTPHPNWAMTAANILDPERWRIG